MAARILRVSATFRRNVEKLGVLAGSPKHPALSTTMRALATSPLPGPGDFDPLSAPTHAHERRATGHTLWLLYRLDDESVFVMTARGQPPVPLDESAGYQGLADDENASEPTLIV